MGLPREWRILVLDMPGHGESSFDPTLDYSPPGMADKVHMVGLLHTQWNLLIMDVLKRSILSFIERFPSLQR